MSGKQHQIPSAQVGMYSNDGVIQSSKYADLLAVIEELGKDIKPTNAGSRSASDRLKRGILHARGLVRECLIETERSARS